MLKKVSLALVVTALPAVSFAQGQTQEQAVAAKGGLLQTRLLPVHTPTLQAADTI